MTTDVKVLSTDEASWGIAKKTALIRAKPLSAILVDGSALDKFLLATLEGDQPVARSNLMCIGATAEPWQQTAKAILKKYSVTAIEDDGWMICTPLPENEVEFFKIVDGQDATHIVGLWGSTIGDLTNLQSFKVGDYVCRQTYDHKDQWIVREALFDATYEILSQPA
jgi:hypothetical protein